MTNYVNSLHPWPEGENLDVSLSIRELKAAQEVLNPIFDKMVESGVDTVTVYPFKRPEFEIGGGYNSNSVVRHESYWSHRPKKKQYADMSKLALWSHASNSIFKHNDGTSFQFKEYDGSSDGVEAQIIVIRVKES